MLMGDEKRARSQVFTSRFRLSLRNSEFASLCPLAVFSYRPPQLIRWVDLKDVLGLVFSRLSHPFLLFPFVLSFLSTSF